MKILVYTVNIGNYDTHKPVCKESNVDYICVSDTKPHKDWDWYKIEKEPNTRRQSRKYKIFPQLFFPDYDVFIYVDSSIEILGPIKSWTLEKLKKDNIAIPAHPRTNCTYKEGEKCIRLGLDLEENIRPQMQLYKEWGFPKDWGLTENNVILRRNTHSTRILQEKWGRLYCEGSHRDQLSLMPASWLTGVNINVLSLKIRFNDNNLFRYTEEHDEKRLKF